MSSRVLTVLPFLLALGCGSSDSTPSASAADSGTPSDTGAVTDTGGTTTDSAKEPCSEPVDERPPGSVCVKTVSGKVVDPSGAPVAGKLVSVCGSICFFGESGADGTFNAAVNQFIKVGNFAASVHGRPGHASLYQKLPSGMDNITLAETMVLPLMPAAGTQIPNDGKGKVTATAPVTHGALTLTFQAGTDMELDIEDVELTMTGKGGDHLRAVKVAEKDYPSYLKSAKLLYAATPFDAKFNKKVGVTINETGGLAEGTAVEFVAIGNEFLKEPFTAGTLEVVATGKVTGGKIVTDVGQGISTLTWIGVRPK